MRLLPRLSALLVAGLAATLAQAVDVNSATQAQLEALPGLGVAMTERILGERETAPFRDWADLTRRVRGLKRSGAARLSAAGLTVAGERYAPTTAASAPR